MKEQDPQRLYIKNQINDNIKKYEADKHIQKQMQERQKLLIKQQILQQLMDRQKSVSQTAVRTPQPNYSSPAINKPQQQFSYSFGDRQRNYEGSLHSSNHYDQQQQPRKWERQMENSKSSEYPEEVDAKPTTGHLTFGRKFKNGQQSIDNEDEFKESANQQVFQLSFQKNTKDLQSSPPYMTESSKYGSYYSNHQMAVQQEMIHSNTSLTQINSQQDFNISKAKIIKKDTIDSLSDQRQIQPPRSPQRSSDQAPSPTKSPGSIYKTAGSSSRQIRDEQPLRKAQNQKSTKRVDQKIENDSQQGESIKYFVQSTSKKDLHKLNQQPERSPKSKSKQVPPLKKINQGLVPLQPQQPKPYGTYIHDDVDEQVIEQLRKKKIEEMEKRRQKRTQERKKSVDEKSFNKESQTSIGQKQQKVQKQDMIQKLPRLPQRLLVPQAKPVLATGASYTNIHKKPRDSEQGSEIDTQSNNTVYSYKSLNKPARQNQQPKRVKDVPQRNSHNANTDTKIKQKEVAPDETPKTITTIKTAKTLGKTIFDECSNKSKQRSHHKFAQQPKIEPKQRKQTFTKQSNKKMMLNALSTVCLPGELNRKQRERLTEIINNDPAEFLIFLFKEYSRKVIKGIYTYDQASEKVRKIYGDKAPPELASENITEFYRYDSGAREFKLLDGCKSFSYVVHGVYIK